MTAYNLCLSFGAARDNPERSRMGLIVNDFSLVSRAGEID